MKNNILKLNYFANLLRPAKLIMIIVLGLLFVVMNVIDKGFKLHSIIIYTCAYVLLYFVCFILITTRKIMLDKDTIHFTYTQLISRRTEGSFRMRGEAKVKYTVTDIENLRFEQNALEKLFNCGHFSFKGNTVYESRSDGFEPLTEFTFYGLTHFRQTKKEICDILGVNETI